MADLLGSIENRVIGPEPLAEGAVILRGFADAVEEVRLLQSVQAVAADLPFRHMLTPYGTMSVAMTNCGAVGWVSDATGYRYDPIDPASGRPWPAIPASLLEIARRAAAAGGFAGFEPDACLVNRYEPGAQMGLHQDKDERDFEQPIVSVSLGLPCRFLWGGAKRNDKPQRIRLESGDVVVWGGPARKVFHGVAALADGNHPLSGRYRFNLTFRKAL